MDVGLHSVLTSVGRPHIHDRQHACVEREDAGEHLLVKRLLGLQTHGRENDDVR